MKLALRVSVIVLIVLSFTQVVFGQTTSSDINVTVTPTTPTPGDTVQIGLSSFSIDLNRSTITWYKDGTILDSGMGVISESVIVGALGQVTSLKITIQTPDNQTLTKTVTITPSDLDLLWEAMDSYVPPFYEGKALPTSQGAIKFVAIPNTQLGSATNNFTYTWKQNFSADQADSGFGKNSLIMYPSYLDQNENINVVANSIVGNYTAENEITVLIQNPLLLFYNDSPLGGIDYSNALSNGFNITETETTIVASPYFIGPKDLTSSNLNFSWTLNNQPTQTPTIKNELVLIKNTNDSGTALIGLGITNEFKLFDDVNSTLQVNL